MSDPFEQLDFLYTPSDDVARDMKYFTGVLGVTLMFTVEGMGARAALIKLTETPPHILLTDHLEGERPIYVYRVENLERSLKEMEKRGWAREETFEIPHGPCCSFASPGGHRVALYQLTRPEAAAHFEGRFDF
jgi:hypothetical protein